jgi:type IV pilus assembly protein PilA
VSYITAFPSMGYSATLAPLGYNNAPCPTPPTTAAACLLDDTLAAANSKATAKSGYYYTYTAIGAAPVGGYTNLSTPSSQNSTGVKNFFTDESGVVRFNATGAPASVSSPAI